MDNSRCKHASDERLSSYVDHRLDGEDLRVLAHHLHECSDCSGVVEDLEQLKGLMATSGTPSTPPNPNFWADTYRSARLKSLQTPVRTIGFAAFGQAFSSNVRLVASSLAAVVLSALLLGPAIYRQEQHNMQPVSKPAAVASIVPAATVVDATTLLRSHAQYDEDTQPFTDDPRLSMVLSEEASQKDDVAAATGIPSCELSDDPCSNSLTQSGVDVGSD